MRRSHVEREACSFLLYSATDRSGRAVRVPLAMMKRLVWGGGALLLVVGLGLGAWKLNGTAAPKGAGGQQFQAAEQALKQGDTNAAETSLQAAVLNEPTNGSYHARLGELQLRQNQGEEAVAELQAAVHFSPKAPHLFCKLARALLLEGRIDEVGEAAETELKQDPKCPDALYARGELKRRTGQNAEALADFQQSLGLKAGFPLAAAGAGALLLEEGKADEARGVLEAGLKTSPNDRGLHALLGEALLRSTDPQAAVTAKEHLRKALPPLPGDPLPPDGNSMEAATEPPDPAKIHAALGQLSFKAGDMADARDEYSRALLSDSTLTEALDGQAEVAEREGKADAAANYRKRSAAVKAKRVALAGLRKQALATPNDAALQLRVARLALDAGAQKEAAEALDAAVRADPGRREARELRAKYYQESGQEARASREYKIAYSLPRSASP